MRKGKEMNFKHLLNLNHQGLFMDIYLTIPHLVLNKKVDFYYLIFKTNTI